MDEIVKAEPDPLLLAETENESRVAWVLRKIVEEGYQPKKPGSPWAGRDDVCEKLQRHFSIGVDEALKIVEQAVAYIWCINRPDDKQARKELTLQRLDVYRGIIFKKLVNPVYEETEKIIEADPENPGAPVDTTYRPWKRKKMDVSMQAVARLLEIEKFECELRGLLEQDGSAENVVGELIKHLDGMAETTEKKTTVAVSVSQAIKTMPADKLGPAGKAKMKAMLDAMQGRKVKKVKSKPVEPEVESQDEEEDGDE